MSKRNTHGAEPWQYRPELGQPRLVGDVNPGALGSSPSGFVSITSTNLAGVFFAAAIGDNSQSANTIMRASEGGNSVTASIAIAPGTISSVGTMVALGDRLFFRASAANGTATTEIYTLSASAPGSFQLTLMRASLPAPRVKHRAAHPGPALAACVLPRADTAAISK